MSKVIRLETGEEQSSSTESNGLFDGHTRLSDVDLNSKTGVLFVLTHYWSIRTGIARWNTAKYGLPFSDVKMSKNGGISASFLRIMTSREAAPQFPEECLRRRSGWWKVYPSQGPGAGG